MTEMLEFADIPYCNVVDMPKCSALTIEVVKLAIRNAASGHNGKKEVKRMMDDIDGYATMVYESIKNCTYKDELRYRRMKKVNRNGKKRDIDSPSLFTRVLQHVFILLIKDRYDRSDNHNGMNCKDDYGITANNKNNSVIHKLKHLYYDRRDLNYAVVIDQRKCYDHVKKKHIRRAMKMLTRDRWLIDFGIDVSFCGERFPIGTPTSPLLHHILCLSFDHWCKRASSFSLRYADNCFLAFATKEEANQALWRVKNFWWYELGIRSKRGESKIVPLDMPLDFCGYVFHRNKDKVICSHDKGYVRVRRAIAMRASRCKNNDSYSSYFGLLQHADAFRLLNKIEKDMKLRELTAKIRIDRSMDAPNIKPSDLVGKMFCIYNYEIRRDANGMANWIKLLIGIREVDEDGVETGRERAYELHGAYTYLVEFIQRCEKVFGKAQMLPLEDMEIEQSCGYIFKGSTNQITYIQ